MAELPINAKGPWRLVIPHSMHRALMQHLFPGDGDEHGATIAAGIAASPDGGVRLLARNLHLAVDGRDYVPGKRGYRMLRAPFIRDRVMECGAERLAYLAIHNHGGTDSVAFSSNDLRSHERGYPALLDIGRGVPIGALVFASQAVAGDIGLPGRERRELASATIVGQQLQRLFPERTNQKTTSRLMYDRQSRLFGDVGQALLRDAKVGIIGLGGVGSIVAQLLGRLGVGRFVLIDPDRIEITNLPRVVGATRWDARTFFSGPRWPAWVRDGARRTATPKVAIARRVIHEANAGARVEAVFGDVLEPTNASKLLDCDYLFLAADTMRARLLFNAIVHQYLIPGVQAGAKVRVDRSTGKVLDVYSVVRRVMPDSGCLWCNGLINPAKLQEEGQSDEERRVQRYVEDASIIAPSVITLNAVAAAKSVDDFLFYLTGLVAEDAHGDYTRFHPMQRSVWHDRPRRDADCIECGHDQIARFARGDARRLPVLQH
jgi:hypothetical protein